MSSDAGFAVNGRFLSQGLTGVQRYARNVVAAMDRELRASQRASRLIVPAGVEDPALHTLPVRETGRLRGHVWEQIELPAAWKGRLLNLCNTAPLAKADQIVCIHDANVFEFPDSYSPTFRVVYAGLQPLLARRAARIATVSKAAAATIARHLPVRIGDIAVLPNGHEHALAWDPSRARLAPAVAAIVLDRPYVLAIGSRAPHKNLGLLLAIAPRLADMGCALLIAGGGDRIYAAEEQRSQANVIATGRVCDDDLAYLLEHALCLAFPSWTEGFGLPIVEAMARGCPVVSSDRASMPEICGNAALFASPAEPDLWIRQVQSLVDSPALRDELIGHGREQVAQFTWTGTAAGYLDVLREPALRMAEARGASSPTPPRVAVVVATRGRPAVVSATVRHLLATQTLAPDITMISCVEPGDAGDLAELAAVTIVTGPPGLSVQRNSALAALPPGIDIVAFFDDDFVAAREWLAIAIETFRNEPDVAAFTGRVLVDGIKGPGLDFAAALRIIETPPPHASWTRIEPFSPYGCNMAFRRASIAGLAFDERLVLYGWLEDRDFGAALAKRGGRLVKAERARGVHMGVKAGRVSGDRLGYSQIVNPLYMHRKGTMTLAQVADHVMCNVAINLVRAVRPEPFIDRRGRLRGNLMGLADALRGRLEPERAAVIRPRVE